MGPCGRSLCLTASRHSAYSKAMADQISSNESIPLLASWGWGDRVMCPSWYIDDRHKQMQNLRWRSAIAIERDFAQLLEFVGPSNANLRCSSSRILALLVRTCIEIESCFKSILDENGVSKSKQKRISEFRSVEKSHSLSQFNAKIHGWHPSEKVFTPFERWSNLNDINPGDAPNWHRDYGKVKHNVLELERYATFDNLCQAICAFHILLISQFGFDNWGPSRGSVGFHNAPEYQCAVGDIVEIRFPNKVECRVIFDLPRNWEYSSRNFDYAAIS